MKGPLLMTVPSRSRARWSRHRLRRGAAAVEFAVVLPLLTLFLLGAADFGRFAHIWIAVTNAARSGGAFAGTTPFTTESRPAWEAGIRRAVRGDLEQLRGFDSNRLRVATEAASDADGRRRVSVTVEYPFDPLINYAALPGSFTLRRTAAFPVTR